VELRPYQRLAVDVLWQYLATNTGNPAIVLPTGAGKSPLMAAIAQGAHTQWQGRVGVLAHTKELISQNADKLRRYWPEAPAGIYSAGLGRRDRFDAILHLQIQSVYRRASAFGPFDLLLVDEGHRIPLKDEGTYRRFIRDCQAINPALRVVVLTATPYRLQGRAVPICGPEHIATEIIYEARIPDLIAEGYLSPLTTKGGECPPLSGIQTRGGEYVEAALATVFDVPELVERACRKLVELAGERKRWLLFAINVSHANHIAETLNSLGVSTAVVWGDMPAVERDATLTALGGLYRAIVNVGVLVEGYDDPLIDLVGDFAATKSPGRYSQKVGRGFRVVYADGFDLSIREGRVAAIAAGPKPDCFYADFAGNSLEHGPVDEIRVQQPRTANALAKVVTGKSKKCPACSAVVPAQTRLCPTEGCGYSWVNTDPSHLDRPIDAPVLSTDRPRVVNQHEVKSVGYKRHEGKSSGRPSLCVTYQCGLRRFSEYVCLEHSGFAHDKALQWWAHRAGAGSVPRTVEEALPLTPRLRTPSEITVDETNKYAQVIAYRFAERDADEQEPVDHNAPTWLQAATRRAA